jgi:hypothetical protein
LVFVNVNVPVPCLVKEPPSPDMTPAKVFELEVPAVNSLPPNVTALVVVDGVELLKSPMVVPPFVSPLISNVEEAPTITAPVDAKEPVPVRLTVPALIVVPPP